MPPKIKLAKRLEVITGPVVNCSVEAAVIQRCAKKHKAWPGVVEQSGERVKNFGS